MSVTRADLAKCIGCRRCYKICPMDVFRFDEERNKSVIAFLENCQSCGQCYLNCPARSLGFSDEMGGYAITTTR